MGIEAGTPPGLMEKIRQIAAEEVAKFIRSGFMRNASIGEGGSFTLKGGQIRAEYPQSEGGGLAGFFGRIVSALDGTYLGTGWLIQAPDGTDMFTARSDAASGATWVNLYDSHGTIIVGNDTYSGQGLARPFVGGGFARARFTDWSVSTTSATFETLYSTLVYKQHPRLEVSVRASMDTAATTGEVRVLVDGVQLGATSSEGFVLSTRYFTGAIAGSHMEPVLVEIQGRVAGGAGALRVESRYWMGKQS